MTNDTLFTNLTGSLSEIRDTLMRGVHELPHQFEASWGRCNLLLSMPDEVMGEQGPMFICYPSVVGTLDSEERVTPIDPVGLGRCLLNPKTGNITPTSAALENLAKAINQP